MRPLRVTIEVGKTSFTVPIERGDVIRLFSPPLPGGDIAVLVPVTHEATNRQEIKVTGVRAGRNAEELAPEPERAPVGVSMAATTTQTVRVRDAFGGCKPLGEFVRETATGFIYRLQNGQTKRAKKDARARHAGFPNPAPHIVPCNQCPENWPKDACMHGTVGPHCERCLSM